ncbi:phosphoribosylglycinamide formyltransferase [Halalkalibacillus sediminis]|uniref:Phosphoribosylglycinamide formyltransferase n=1 Tax=Halalkalibacillus sediminis TaxID=2018042 RepID=A0A2I0QQE9_9BACI|nr:phosphoribosylglycinamide formyltransferase [Halalkalibacillus sediminis]PKR76554.1 phosphoribosylglycinamide formyltransferase [Halalkalibacillus sediminis]
MKRIAIFASGSGSNFESIVQASRVQESGYEVVYLFSDRPKAFVLERAKKFGIEADAFSPKDFSDKIEYESKVLSLLQEKKIDLVVLAGYMRLIGPTILREFEGRIMNIHPSYLPAFPGKDAIGQALDSAALDTGVTVHFVDDGMDTGPIIEQVKIQIEKQDTYESLQEKIQKVEHELYPKTIASVAGRLGEHDQKSAT